MDIERELTLYDFAKNNMFAIQPRSGHSSDEKLGALGIRSSIGHR